MGYTLRAVRFPLQLPMRYRESGTLLWYAGKTVNISRTGILFKAEQEIPVQTALEMRIAFPPSSKMTLICRGPVVRKQKNKMAPESSSLMATVIRGCRLLPKRPPKGFHEQHEHPGRGSG